MSWFDVENITFTKVVVMVVLGASSFLCGTLPLLLSYCYDKKEKRQDDLERLQRSRQRVVSLLMSFAGGVLFCTVFIHLLPEVGEVFEDLRHQTRYKKLPEFLPQALLCAGFFVMYLVEEIAHTLMHADKKDSLPEELTNDEVRIVAVKSLPTSIEGDNRYALSYKNTVFFNNVMNITEEASKELSNEDRTRIIALIKSSLVTSNINDQVDIEIDTSNPIRDSIAGKTHESDAPHEMELVTAKGSAIRSFLLALALSIHALFEGMAIGLESKPSAVCFMAAATIRLLITLLVVTGIGSLCVFVWSKEEGLMLLGVGSHKMVLSACMGIEMVAGNISVIIHIVYVTMFAIVSPIGIGAGLVVSSEQDVAAAIFQGIAAGTLLYVLFYEVLERSNPEHNTSGFLSLFMVLLGFAVMLTLQIVADS